MKRRDFLKGVAAAAVVVPAIGIGLKASRSPTIELIPPHPFYPDPTSGQVADQLTFESIQAIKESMATRSLIPDSGDYYAFINPSTAHEIRKNIPLSDLRFDEHGSMGRIENVRFIETPHLDYAEYPPEEYASIHSKLVDGLDNDVPPIDDELRERIMKSLSESMKERLDEMWDEVAYRGTGKVLYTTDIVA